MAVNNPQDSRTRPAGYAALIRMFGIAAPPNWHESMVAEGGMHGVLVAGDVVRETYTSRYWPGDELGDHLEFALKYDGVNLAVLALVFAAAGAPRITACIKSKPTGKYSRRIWYLYELITGDRLPLDDIKKCGYVDLLDPSVYFTAVPATRVRRQCVNDNLPGDGRFCPLVRRTEAIQRFIATDFPSQCRRAAAGYSPALLKRALGYLYTKETRSSFAIEHVKPEANRTEMFIALLQHAERDNFCQKPQLVELQNRIVDPRFAARDYRRIQNYVGESVGKGRQQIHFVCPKPDDLPDLMAGLIAAHDRMEAAEFNPVIHAAAIAWGFVFLHPFEDGNGRVHRFLIHNILARRKYIPDGLMLPVSAAMLREPNAYDASLEMFSKPLLPLVQYTLDETGRMEVHGDTAVWYRFIDMTPQVEALFVFIDQTIETDLVAELNFLVKYDHARQAIGAIVDMPDRLTDLFIRFCLQNHGRLSAAKQSGHFAFLTDDEIRHMEQAVQAAGLNGDSASEP